MTTAGSKVFLWVVMKDAQMVLWKVGCLACVLVDLSDAQLVAMKVCYWVLCWVANWASTMVFESVDQWDAWWAAKRGVPQVGQTVSKMAGHLARDWVGSTDYDLGEMTAVLTGCALAVSLGEQPAAVKVGYLAHEWVDLSDVQLVAKLVCHWEFCWHHLTTHSSSNEMIKYCAMKVCCCVVVWLFVVGVFVLYCTTTSCAFVL